jgi:sugar lactone lactonase YvrE
MFRHIFTHVRLAPRDGSPAPLPTIAQVQVFRASDGVFVRGIGGNVGSGVGQLDCPMSVAVDDGLVYVSDLTSHRIQVFRESDGHFVTTLGEGVGSGEGQLTQPSGLALDGKGFLFVAEIANNRVQRFRCPTDNLVS